MAQVNAYIDTAGKLAFEAYAQSVGLEAGTLLRLLIAREMRRRCLADLAARGEAPTARRQPHGQAVRDKVTAHYGRKGNNGGTATDFANYAKACGTNKAAAARFLLDRELSEQWLGRCLLLD